MPHMYIVKSTGERETFSAEKLRGLYPTHLQSVPAMMAMRGPMA